MTNSPASRPGYLKWLPKLLWLTALLLVLFTVWPHFLQDHGEQSLNAVQARAFLSGHLDVPAADWDIVQFQGRNYIPFPPFPSLLVLPLVALLGVSDAKIILIGLLLTVLNVWSLKKILAALEIPKTTMYWLLAAFFLGTTYWFNLLNSRNVYGFSSIVAASCLLLALREAFGSNRGWLVGLLLGCAFLSRQMTMWALPFLAALAWERGATEKRWWRVSGLTAGFGLGLGIYFLLNYMRFGNIFNTGYGLLVSPMFLKPRMEQYGLFHPAYFMFNFTYLFLQGFHFQFTGSDMLTPDGLDFFGTSLTAASPFLFFAFAPKSRHKWIWAAWISVALAVLHTLFYYNNGWIQLNCQRFTLDFMPVLIVLVALGVKEIKTNFWKYLVAYAILLNVIAIAVLASPHK